MINGISIVMPTGRGNPRFREMADALWIAIQNTRQRSPGLPVEWIVVDMRLWSDEKSRRQELIEAVRGRFPVIHVPPKPTVWQGPERYTSKDRWDKSSASNTGFVYANYDHVACFDDCTVVDPDWLIYHHQAALMKVAAAGGYKYLKPGAVVEEGRILSGEVCSDDHRLRDQESIGPSIGAWLFGGNMSLPLKAILETDGYEELMSGSGGLEDCEFGVRVERAVNVYFFPPCLIYQLSDTHDAIDNYLGGATAEAQGKNNKFEAPERCKGFWYKDELNTMHWMTWNHLPVWRLTGHRAGKRPDGTLYPLYDKNLEPETHRKKPVGNVYSLRYLRKLVRMGQPLPHPKWPTRDWRDGQDLKEM